MIAGLTDQARRRLEMARHLGREPERWVASPEVIDALEVVDGRLHGVPVTIGETRSEWGLDLVLVKVAGPPQPTGNKTLGHAGLHEAV